ncbi:hypothetical protein [Marinobacter nitratireducens]|uniref:hypothetical protein n=1 Tax=Marinobacter nitratireducens TaxID=1137280 RepID=UPI0005683083|nr:hypothetical protein [Marinobacter nitratireducens]
MDKKALDNLVQIRKLKLEPPDPSEVQGLIKSGRARLQDAKLESLSPESRFDLAYNAAHALSLAALRQCGYRSDNRYLVFQCLKHTLGLPPQKWRVLDQAHRKRNLAEYEGFIDVDESLLSSLIRVTDEINALVEAMP